jgi:hypothetical protein
MEAEVSCLLQVIGYALERGEGAVLENLERYIYYVLDMAGDLRLCSTLLLHPAVACPYRPVIPADEKRNLMICEVLLLLQVF